MRSYFENYANMSLYEWFESIGVDGSLANDTLFPTYSPRESLKLWMNTYLYLENPESNSELVEWVKSLFSATETSMIRDAIGTTEGESTSAVTVYDKAGWVDGDYVGAVNDAGIIAEGDSTYLLSVMTSAPTSSSNFAKVSALVSAVWEARDCLVPFSDTMVVE